MGQVFLARDVPPLGFELFKRHTFSPDSMKIEETY
jgi:hypothetical protein